ncbi:MAG: hypothetical protein HY684_07750 [Chloroflexi bacterium]|nr:hypothetical protein [Chloroflexota bacterium]
MDAATVGLISSIIQMVGAAAIFILAVALVITTRRFAHQTEYMAIETSKHAAATSRLAEAAREQSSREVIPVLGLRALDVPLGKEGAVRFEVKNAGLGPAMNVRCCVEGLGITSEVWQSTALGSGEWLGQPEAAQVKYTSGINGGREPASEAEIPHLKASYEDVLGYSYESLFLFKHPPGPAADGSMQGRLTFRRIERIEVEKG